jgi:hypothetical protein
VLLIVTGTAWPIIAGDKEMWFFGLDLGCVDIDHVRFMHRPPHTLSVINP